MIKHEKEPELRGFLGFFHTITSISRKPMTRFGGYEGELRFSGFKMVVSGALGPF